MINHLYCNGSSLSAGGGLYETGVKNEYKKLYDILWTNEKDVTYAKYVADYFKLDLTHEAECGSGAPRLVRKTYEFIEKIGIDNAKKTLFIFEITDPAFRIDMYCERIKDYVIVNPNYDENIKIKNLSAVHSYSPNFRAYDDSVFVGDVETKIKTYLENFHNPILYSNKFVGELVGLFSFLEKCEIEFFYFFENDYLRNPFKTFYEELDKKHRIYIDDSNNYNSNDNSSISHYCTKNKLTIKDELNNYTSDTHPGFYGYKKFSEIIISNIVKRIGEKIINIV